LDKAGCLLFIFVWAANPFRCAGLESIILFALQYDMKENDFSTAIINLHPFCHRVIPGCRCINKLNFTMLQTNEMDE
jgi:hypothetical protein